MYGMKYSVYIENYRDSVLYIYKPKQFSLPEKLCFINSFLVSA